MQSIRDPNILERIWQSEFLREVSIGADEMCRARLKLTYGKRSFCGVKRICSPGEAVETKGEIEGKGSDETHRMCSSWHCFSARHSY